MVNKRYINPMLAKLGDKPFNSPEWIYEIKWDGYRAIADVNKKEIRLYSRNKLSFAERYPVVIEALKKIKKNVILDGEIIAVDPTGLPSFQLLQQYEQNKAPLVYYVFDCLYRDNKSLKEKPLLERKKILKKLLPENNIIQYCDHIEERGVEFFMQIKKKGLEGIIAKKADSLYYEGKRSANWLKIKHMQTQEAVIAGYTVPEGGRKYFGSLVLGVYKRGELSFIGHTGTGFNDQSLKEIYDKMQKLVIKNSPFKETVKINGPVIWVKPKLVCNIKFAEITSGKLRRIPVFLGLRIDKKAKDVHDEYHDHSIKSNTVH